MARTGIEVRLAEADELGEVAAVLVGARADAGVTALIETPNVELLEQRLRAFMDNVPGRIAVTGARGSICGICILQRQVPGLFSASEWLEVQVLYVLPEARRHGVGRALLADAAAYATACDIQRIVTQPTTGSRSEARFLSRLGFVGLGARRAIETAVLHRRLEHPEGSRSRPGLGSVIARRRALATPSRGLPLGAVAAAFAGGDGIAPERPVEAADAVTVTDAVEGATTPAGSRYAEASAAVPGESSAPTAAPGEEDPSSRRQVRRAELMRRSASSVISTR